MAHGSAGTPQTAIGRVLAALSARATRPAGRDLFTRLLLASCDETSLKALTTDDLTRHAEQAWSFIADKPAGGHKIAWRRAEPGGAQVRPVTVVEILNDDMPFLLDSVLAEVQARGLPVALVLHPIFKTRRRERGSLEDVTGSGDRAWSDGRQESYISLHLRALAEPDAQALVTALSAILDEVRVVVGDWKSMLARVDAEIAALRSAPPGVPRDRAAEAVAFLEWLERDHFTFLGAREYRLAGDAATGELVAVDGKGLGLLRDPRVHVLRRGRELVAMTPEVRRFFFQPTPLIITKANVVARVHRRAHMDYIGAKIYGRDGKPAGELRLIGLFTSQAYVRSPREIPIVRLKVERVIKASGYPPESHAGKALLNVLDTFPRDELFQISTEELERWTAGILDLEVRPRVRVFARIDRFDRFVSVLVFAPRDRYTTTVRERIGNFLAATYEGRISAFYPYFMDGPLVRVQFIVGRTSGPTPVVDPEALERGVAAIVRTWSDQLADAIEAAGGDYAALVAKYGRAFSAGYSEMFDPGRALEDIGRMERLSPERPLAIDFYRDPAAPEPCVRAAIYRLGASLRLSERVPVLENLGFSVIDERSYRVTPRFADGEHEIVLHDMALETSDGSPVVVDAQDKRLEECFLAVFAGFTENDGFNRLIMRAGANWREVAILRAYAGYLRQLGSAFGLRSIADALSAHAGVTRDILELFNIRFDPGRALDPAARSAAEKPVAARIEGALASVQSLDEDRILRQTMALVQATVRTNFYQQGPDGSPPQTVSFKFASRDLALAPEPRPFREIWVASPRVDGVHLRFAPIARGGIRWSDRPQDFRTEVLGLAKAQHVKNAVIVPAGAKGGFVPKQLARSASRDEVQKEGVAAYRIFIDALLDLTDNIEDGRIVPPERTIRHDGDDPYLVVAADKGTATFSDLANEIADEHGFWLGDAFASGGSAGYDHKKIGITARGGWECVQRHFREMDRDIAREPFTAIGVGDMSGDVFGNGMLQSGQMRLLAAFDHRDIFIDPDPEPASSFAERKRLFDLPRSSWQDYDRAQLSAGGGVFSRSAKSIPLSPQVRRLLGVDQAEVTPAELMHAILACEADLLWFGGIGTFVRAAVENDAEVGDRVNDVIRITAGELRVKVVGEGANLGMTQRARVEFAARGGRLNTDFIDNSAGVNTSDQEVNIEIGLTPAVRAGRLTVEARNALLADMTDDVAAAVLRNNYQQSLALSLAERGSAADLGLHSHLIRALEARGMLDRRLDALPSDRELAERQRTGRGLFRPELALLLSHAKIALLHDLLASDVPDDAYMQDLLLDYFAPVLRNSFADDLRAHRLRREIIATTLTNGLVNRLGAATPLRLAEETARPVTDTAYAFMATRAVFGLAALWQRIDALDGRVRGAVQLDLYERVRDVLVHGTVAFLRQEATTIHLSETIEKNRAGLASLRTSLPKAVPEALRARRSQLQERLIADGVPADLADDITVMELLADTPAIVAAARAAGFPVPAAAAVHFAIDDLFRISELSVRARDVPAADDYDRVAIAGAFGAIGDARAAITRAALRMGDGSESSLDRWLAPRRARVERTVRALADIAGNGVLTVARLTVAASRLTDLARDAEREGAQVPA